MQVSAVNIVRLAGGGYLKISALVGAGWVDMVSGVVGSIPIHRPIFHLCLPHIAFSQVPFFSRAASACLGRALGVSP